MTETHYCIFCGKSFTTDDPGAIYCPEHAGQSSGKPVEEHPGAALPPSRSKQKSAQTTSNEQAEWKPGDLILDTYEVKEKLGKGGFGAVYRAHHRGWNMDLAVKRALNLDDENKQDFVDEAQRWIDLGLYPYIISCYYVRNIDGFPHTFAELAEGGSLHDWIQGDKGNFFEGNPRQILARILDLSIQFAWGLGFAHQQGLIHGDVKPQNALMTPEGVLKVTDFGLARAGRGVSESAVGDRGAKGGKIVYSPYHCSPEQRMGRDLSLATDIWSWGVSVLEMFNGGIYWAGGQVAAYALQSYLGRKGEEEDLPPMPGAVAELLRACFQEEPQNRPKNMQMVAEQLIAIYHKEANQVYDRKKPKPADMRADSLNNKALSLFDLGNHDEAVKTWQLALQLNPTHLEASYNLGYWEWAHAESDDMRFLQKLSELESVHQERSHYWLGLSQFHQERGALKESERCWEKATRLGSTQAPVKSGADIQPQHSLNAPVGLFCLRLSPNNRLVLVGGLDKTIRLIELSTNKVLQTYVAERNFGEIHALGVTPKWDKVVCGSGFATLEGWDVVSGQHLGIFHDEGVNSSSASVVTALEFSPDGRTLYSALREQLYIEGFHEVHLWDFHSRKLMGSLKGQYKSINCLALSPDGCQLVTSGWSNDRIALKLWDLESRHYICDLVGHDGLIYCLAIAPDGRYMLSGCQDGVIGYWDLRNRRLIHEMYGHHGSVRCVTFHPNGQFALSGGEDCTIRFWDLQSGRCLRTVTDNSDTVYSVSFSSDGLLAISASKDGSIRSYSTHLEIQRCCDFQVSLPASVEKNIEQQTQLDGILEMANVYQQEGRKEDAYNLLRKAQLITGFEKSKRVLDRLHQVGIDARRSGLNAVWLSFALEGHDDAINSLILTNDGRTAISASSDLSLRFWDLEKRICTDVRIEHRQPLSAVLLSPDEKFLVSASKGYYLSGKDADQYLRVWQISGWQQLHDFQTFEHGVNAATFSPTGQVVFVGCTETIVNSKSVFIQALDVHTGKILQPFEGHTDVVTCISVFGEGRYLLSGSRDTTLKIWEVKTGDCIRTLDGHKGGIFSLAVLNDGRYALSGGVDNLLRLWDLNAGTCIREMAGHMDTIHAIAVTPDGRFALTGGEDRALRLWDLQEGIMLQTLKGHTDCVNAIVFSSDGRYALSGGFDKEIRVWEFDWEYSWS